MAILYIYTHDDEKARRLADALYFGIDPDEIRRLRLVKGTEYLDDLLKRIRELGIDY